MNYEKRKVWKEFLLIFFAMPEQPSLGDDTESNLESFLLEKKKKRKKETRKKKEQRAQDL